MPMNEEGKLEHAAPKPSDPAHGSSENTNHTTKHGEKPTTAKEAIMDPSFFPTLHGAPLAQKVKSYLFLVSLVFGAVATLWFCGYELLQTTPPVVQVPLVVPGTEGGYAESYAEVAKEVGILTTGASAMIMLLLYITGTSHIDFWSLVIEYGWWTLPLAGFMGILFVIMAENTESIREVD
ncbi:hypothetical protein BKA67DRAFT_562500 [Truncatella angustata]|uniref:Transmembrane protein n=1 Tax=Truncatella angustata TaxID=152316 RepID=A0A9P8UPQ1_9PEZI|nr:uncharacterized protein BKA67DRAFT_562500 [Truncatella angustata]KAH6656040.1 hypothetical protein BKA67DRAFT_562500 [Truncatella angustata]KAH8198389.1 hypothetical protein TruAng_007424 [Truncatella angustata]